MGALAAVAVAGASLLACSPYDKKLLDDNAIDGNPNTPIDQDASGANVPDAGGGGTGGGSGRSAPVGGPDTGVPAAPDAGPMVPTQPEFDPFSCSGGECWWSHGGPEDCRSAGAPRPEDRPSSDGDGDGDAGDIYLGWTQIRLGSTLLDGSVAEDAWQGFGLDLDGICTNSATCPGTQGAVSCTSLSPMLPFDGELCRDNTFARLQPIAAQVPELGDRFGISEDVFNCELWHGSYNIVVRVSGYNGEPNDSQVRVDFYASGGVERDPGWECPLENYRDDYPIWLASTPWRIDESVLTGPVEEPGSLPESSVADPEAYVKYGYLVARVPDGSLLRLAGDGMPYRGFPLVIYQGIWVGHLLKAQDGTWTMRDGLATGRVTKEDLVLGWRQVGFCQGMGLDPFYDAVVTYVDENADTLASGEVDPEAPCDAISLGIGFEAKQVTPGSVVPLEPLIECCAPGDSIEQCMTVCGDGAVTGDEQCDTGIADPQTSGACPTSCAPLDACTPLVLTGTECATQCAPTPITAFIDGDQCCPDGADATTDNDCDPVCDNGVLEAPDESCDPIADCPAPSSCTSPDVCLRAEFTGSAAECTAKCTLVAITACDGSDGCCPAGCTQANDDDCSATCGDGFIDPARETCDVAPAMTCPASCADTNNCTTDRRTGSASNCNVVCTHTAITQPANGDGCCPMVATANANTDNDCPPRCPNGVVEGTELCDGNCPSSCNDNVACTANVLVGTAGSCNARCTFPAITAPANNDGCCPNVPSANANNDNDCDPVCGNSVIESGELCDDGDQLPNDGCDANCQIESDQQMCLNMLPDNDACAQCSCLNCRQVTVNCYGSSNATANAQCEAMITCGQENGCANPGCYCGTADQFTCIFGGANGPCIPEVEAAAGSSNPWTILDRSTNTNYALGRANALVECATMQCPTECNL